MLVPVYLPSLVLIQALLVGWLAGSGFQYPDWPFTLWMMPLSVLCLFASFMFLLMRSIWGSILLLAGVVLSLPYLLPTYFSILIKLIEGKEGAIFPASVLSLVLLIMAFTSFKAMRLAEKDQS
jgi:hypothetical protein